MNLIEVLSPLRSHSGLVRTTGLDDATLLGLAERFPELVTAAQAAVAQHAAITAEFPELMDADEQAQIDAIRQKMVAESTS